MMFPWNIAKSAEAIFSRWAVRRACKFLLKKKLGKFILGDIDLDQLEIQLTQGTIQLSDLALNVDYINDKFGAAASVIIKEGSIGSLLVKLPWKGTGCQVEVDEVELVLAPFPGIGFMEGEGASTSNQDDNQYMDHTSEKFGHEKVENAAKPASSDVHEGVKTIAKLVKWFLTSFHVKLNKLIIAFDPDPNKNKKNEVEFERTLVLRIMEIECGTCMSEDADSKLESFFGISRLTNFVKFQAAVVELLHVDKVDDQSRCSCTSGTSPGNLFSCSCSSNLATQILVGEKGGFSGCIKLSIPWKNGSLDIRKVDADINVDPVELRFQPSTLKWFFSSWENYKSLNKGIMGHNNAMSTESEFLNAGSHVSSMAGSSAVIPNNKIPSCGILSSDVSSPVLYQSAFEAMPPGSRFIPDWVPFPLSENPKDSVLRKELDLGESVDQFFECFDELRSSQSALGSSGMWNWTCSVFSAITAASSLASGSLHIPSEQQHIQTNLKATFAGLRLMFDDGNHRLPHNQMDSQMNNDLHLLGVECRDIHVVFQVCPQEMRLEGTVQCIEVTDYFHNERDAVDSTLHSCVSDHMLLIQRLQAEVQGSLPPFALFADDRGPDKMKKPVSADFLVGNKRDFANLKLLKTSGITNFCYKASFNPSDGSLRWPASFSLELPPFIFWVNFWLIDAVLTIVKEVVKCVDMEGASTGIPSEASNENHRSTKNSKKQHHRPGAKALFPANSVRGDISVLNARVLLCFPFERASHLASYTSWDQFFVLDFNSPSTMKKGMTRDASPLSNAASQTRWIPRARQSLHLIIGGIEVYLVNSKCNDGRNNPFEMRSLKCCVDRVMSISSRTDSLSVISMLWLEDSVTGPEIATRAKSLATSDESSTSDEPRTKVHEFATLHSAKDSEEKYVRTKEEIVSSSAFVLNLRLFSVRIILGCSQYIVLNHLLDQMINVLKCSAGHWTSIGAETSVNQTSILVEADSIEILIRPHVKPSIKGSIQNELPGSWHHLRMKVKKLSLLCVSSIGGTRGSTFFWLAHGEGCLWGSIAECPDSEFVLISCRNSTMKRGDGGGSNALSSRSAGTDIVHLWEPEKCHGLTSITIRCLTFVALGGRLDWLDSISSFFIVPPSEVEKVGDNNLQTGVSEHHGSSFVFKFIDVGLCYEPHSKNSMIGGESSSSNLKEDTSNPIGCLLAASSLSLSNTSLNGSINNDYAIRVQDLGLLICSMSNSTNPDGNYSVGHLHKIGYVRVARDPVIEAMFRTNSKDGFLWEFECSKSHICLETCHDTTSGLLQLVTQLQDIFAPDMEESLVHLQSRWNSFRQVQDTDEYNDNRWIPKSNVASSAVSVDNSTVEGGTSVGFGLIDEICENAFHFNHSTKSFKLDSSQSRAPVSAVENLSDDEHLTETSKIPFEDLSFNESVSVIKMESNLSSCIEEGYVPEMIEGYCLSELRSLSELSVGRQPLPRVLIDAGKVNGGWYENSSIRIVENHISDASEEDKLKHLLEDKYLSDDCAKHTDSKEATGRVLLKNLNVKWRMYAGSDWHGSYKNKGKSVPIHARDATSCLELSLSGMRIQYDTFPDGGTSVSKLFVSVQDFYISDRSKAAPWKLVLGCYCSKDHPRESTSKLFKLGLETVRPDPLTPLEEYRLSVALLPLLLHLHQSQLDFLIGFFSKSSSVDQSLDQHQDFGVPKTPESSRRYAIADEAMLPFFQKFDVWPILVRVDYTPSRVDLSALRGGKYVELVNLIPWKGVELQLKHVHAVGVYGWASVFETMMGEWLEDISQNQVHKVLRGIPTIRSLVAVATGASKLVTLPVESYRKDHRVLKGMQRGAVAFLKSISLEAVGLGVHLAAGAHDILLQAEYILTSVPPQVKRKTNVRFNQPKNAQQGIYQACASLGDGLEKSAAALVRTPFKEYQRGATAGSVLATAVRSVPAAAIAPASACASAVHYALLGVRNSLDLEHKKESLEKYMGPSELRE